MIAASLMRSNFVMLFWGSIVLPIDIENEDIGNKFFI